MIKNSLRLPGLRWLDFVKLAAISWVLLMAMACKNNSEHHDESTAEPLPATFPRIDPERDFLSETEYGILNGSQLPASVALNQGGRHFDYGTIEVRTYPDETFFGEQISYRLKQSKEWLILPTQEFAFFVGFDGKRHILIDQGSNVDNRTLQLWEVHSGRKAYSGTYNKALFKQGHLYLLRYAGQGEVENPPRCDPSQFPGGHYAFELVLALDLRNYQEHKTGQVLCTYAQ
jgi:hypothetical protein